MYPILEKRLLAEGIWLMKVLAPRVARSAQPGQFVIVRVDEHGERIPLTISDFDAAEGSVTIVTQAIGASTRKICALNEGDALADFAGPLGHPSEFVKMPVEELRPRRYLFVAGGVGTAPVYPQVKWLRKHGVKADVIIGAKTRDMLIYTDAMRAVAENLHIATDDGSEGFKGLVTALIGELIEKEGRHYDECVAIGPMIMMKFVALTTKKYALKTTVSLNALMVDGTGMCGACRVTVGGRTRFTCVEGPEFDGHEVDFDEAMRRQGMYRNEEQRAAAIEAEREAGHQNAIAFLHNIYSAYNHQTSASQYNELKLETEINALEIVRQRHINLILLLTFILSMIVSAFLFYLQYKRKEEMKRLLQQESDRLKQENKLLKQAEELSVLREKAGMLREELLRKMEVFKKLPSLDNDTEEDKNNNRQISLTDNEWREIRVILDSNYDHFTTRLKQEFPALSVADINFCCLIKINVSLHDMSNIYCISRNSVSKKKLRMKEKLGITSDEGISLDEYLQKY